MDNIKFNRDTSINFDDIKVKKTTHSVAEALLNTDPFELSDDVVSGKAKIVVDVKKEKIYV